MADDLKDEIKLGLDASGVETGVSKAKRSIDDLGKSVDAAGKRGGRGFDGVGQGANKASADVDSATRRMVSSLQRQVAAAEAGGTATRAYQESIARLRGANMDVLRPYLDQLDQANRKTEEAKSQAEGLTNAFRGVSNKIVALASGVAAAFSLRKFIDETVAAQNEQAQLAAVLKSTGNAAGFSQQRLNDMAEQMAQATKFSAGEINTAQTRLLSYTGVVGEQLPRALQAAANMSTRMGIDLASASEQVGRALDVPSQGLTALTRQGFRFTEEQKELITKLEETGKTAEAQGIILAALESSYGGAATAARDTLGGALKALQNNINSLMTGEGGSITGLRDGIESVNTVLSSPKTREAFQTFLGWIATVSAKAIEGAANLLTFLQSADKLGIITGSDKLGKLKAEAADVTAHIARLTDQAERYQESISRGFNVDQNQRNLERTRQKIGELQKQAMAASQQLKDFANAGVKAATAPILTPDLPVVSPKPTGPSKSDIAAANKELAEQQKLIAELSGLTGTFYTDWDRLNAMYRAGKLSVDQLTEAQKALLEKQPAIKANMAEQAKAQELVNKSMDAQIDAITKQFDAMEKAQEAIEKARASSATSAQQSVTKMRDENEALRLAAAMNISQAKAIELVTIKRLEETRAQLLSQGGHKKEIESIEQEIAARKELINQIGSRDEFVAAQQEMVDMWKSIDQTAHDTFVNIFEDGAGTFKRLGQTLKAALLDWLYQMTVRKWIINIGASFGGVGGLAGGAMAGQGGGGLLGMASNANGAYGLFGGGIGSFGSGLSAGFGALFGEAGLSGAMSAGSVALGAGNIAGGLGTIVGALGPIALGVGALASAFGLFAQTVKRGDVLTGTLGGDIRSGNLMRKGGSLFGGPDWFLEDTGASPMNKAIQAQWTASKKTIEDWSKTLGLSTDKIAGFTTTLGTETLGDHGALGIRLDQDGKMLSDQEIQAKIAAAIRSGSNELAQELIGSWTESVAQVTRNVMQRGASTTDGGNGFNVQQVTEDVTTRTYTPSEFARDGEQAIDTLQRLGTSLAGVNSMFDTLGLTLYESTLKGGDMASQLADAAGGLDKLQASSASYFQNFYTASEQQAVALRQVTGEFDRLGIAMPAGRQAFRDIVDGLDLTTESGRSTYVALLGVSDAFAQLMPDLSAVAGELSSTIASVMLGTFEGENPGAALAQITADGIYNAIAGGFAQQITSIIVSGVVEPVVAAAMTGASVSAAVSSEAIAQMVAQANAVAAAAAEIMNNPEFRAAMDSISQSVATINVPTVRATISVRDYSSAVRDSASAADRAADRIKDAWKSIGDTLMDEVNRIRGSIADAGGQSVSYWEGQLAIETAKARAGDQDAAKNLTGISQNLLRASDAQSGTQLERQQMRAWVAQSLQDSAGYAYTMGGAPAPNSDPALLAKIDLLRQKSEEQAESLRRMTRVLERWNSVGMPAEQAVS